MWETINWEQLRNCSSNCRSDYFFEWSKSETSRFNRHKSPNNAITINEQILGLRMKNSSEWTAGVRQRSSMPVCSEIKTSISKLFGSSGCIRSWMLTVIHRLHYLGQSHSYITPSSPVFPVQTFIANHGVRVQRISEPEIWDYVPLVQNCADFTTRPIESKHF